MEQKLLCVLVAGGVAAALYLNSIPGDFVFDDHEAIETNKDVRSDTPLSEVFSNDFWGFPLSGAESHKSYRPLTVLTFRWNRLLHDMWSPGFHVVNVLLHAMVSSLYTWVCCCIGTGHRVATIAGVLFASHPIHTEAVANIVGRTELLSSLFFLLSLLAYDQLVSPRRHTHTNHTSSAPPSSAPLWFGLTVILAVLSLLSKEQGITVLAVCLAQDIFIASKMDLTDLCHRISKSPFTSSFSSFLTSPLGGNSLSSLFKRGILLVGSALLILSFRLYLNGGGSPLFVESDNPASFSAHLLTRGLTYMYLCALNMWLLLFPSRLCFDWSMGSIPLVESWTDSRNLFTLLSFLLFAAILLRTGFYQVKEEVIPANCYENNNNNNNNSNNNNNEVTESANQVHVLAPPLLNHHHSNMRTKKPHSSKLSKLAGNHDNLPKPSKKHLMLFSLALLILPYIPASNLLFPVGFVVAERTLYLPSMGACLMVAIAMEYLASKSEVLKRAVLLLLAVTVTMYSVKTLRRNYEWTDIKILSESAVRVNPTNAKVYMTIGNYYAQQGYRKCEVFYREALRLRPHYATAWTNLGLVLLNTDRPQEAEESYRRALSGKADHINANTNMGHLCRLQGRWPEARRHYETVLTRRPNSPLLLYNLGLVLEQMEDMQGAEQAWRKSLQLVPGYSDSMLALARLLASTDHSGKRLKDTYSEGKRMEKAIQLYRQLQGSADAEVHYEFGRILRYKGSSREAKRKLQLALAHSPSHARAHFELAKLYREAGKEEEANAHYRKAVELDPSLREHSLNRVS